jgi:anti-anti-sigma regulatory factor
MQQPAPCGIPIHLAFAFAGDLDLAHTTASDVCFLLPRTTTGSVTGDLGAVTLLDSAGVGFLLKLLRRADDMGAVLDVSTSYTTCPDVGCCPGRDGR